MNKFLLLSVLSLLCITFITGITGCGDDSTGIISTPTPVINPTQTPYPLADQKIQFLTEAEIASQKGMPCKRLDFFAKCVNTSKIYPSSNISVKGGVFELVEIGDMLYSISKELQVESDLAKIDEEIQNLGKEIDELNQKLNELSTQLALTQVNIQTYISSLNVQNYITPIKTAYSTTSEVGLVYYSTQALLNKNNDPSAVPLSTLQTQEKIYISNVTAPSGIALQIQGIHDSICPDLASLNGVLKDYTNKIILDSGNQNVKNSANVMSTYLLLETYYSQLLTYQFQGLTILANAYNCQDPTGNQTKSYVNGTFKTLLKDEMSKYLSTVNYLVVNLVDYRDANFYAQDMAYYKQGLATDNLYLSVLARSRFFCAQIMQAYENDFGIYGAIVTPQDYTGGSDITLSFQGPSSFNKTIKAAQIAGVYPYTKWTDSKGTVIPDNQWLFYDMPSTDPNIPGGTYSVSLVDSSSSWPHTDNQLGTISIKYYDPNNPDPNTATTSPTATNTLPFGYFSLKWPWNIQRMCTGNWSNWVIPTKTSYVYPDGSHNNDLNNPDHSNLDNCTFDLTNSASSDFGFINVMHIVQPSQKISTTVMKYVIDMPIIPGGAPGDSTTASGKIIYYNTVKITSNASESQASTSTQYNFLFNDTTKDKTESISKYNNSSHSINLNTSNKGLTSFTIYKGSSCNVSVDESYFTGAYKSCTSSADMTVTWYMQFIYTNTYNIFQ